MNILLVEDGVVVRAYLEKHLCDLGYEVTCCADAETALDAYQQAFYPVIILDLRLPGMDGFEFCRRIQPLPQRERSMILVITADEDLETLQKALDVGIDDYLIKPVNIDQLQVRLTIIERQWHHRIERQQMEVALRESEERFRALFESLQDVFYRTDPDGHILLASPSIVQLLGYTQEEAYHLNLGTDIFVDPEQWHEFVTFFEKEGELKEFEVLLKRCDGSEVWGSLTSQWYTDNQGRILGIEGIIRDASEHKQAEEKLLQLRKAVETMRLGVTITDKNRHIIYTNPADAAMHGYSVEELLGKDVRIFAPTELSKPILLDQIEEMQGWIRESINIRKDGSTFPVQLRSDHVKDDSGKIIAIVTTCEDITERKRTEEELQKYHEHLEELVQARTVALQREIAERERTEQELQKAKEAAEAASRAKSTFLANMSHELRTPLNAILGYAQILKATPTLSERQKEGLETIKRSGEHLLTLITDILDISKIEAGRMELQLSELYLPVFLKHIADMIRIRAENQGLAFVYECDPDLPIGIYADEKRLRQILINLLGNAVKFTEKGRVTFRVGVNPRVHPAEGKHVISRVGVNPRVHPAEGKHVISRVGVNPHVHPAEGKHVISRVGVNPRVHPAEGKHTGIAPTHIIRFEVEDTGIGIAPEKLHELFLPFHQIGEQRHRAEGTGLGLAISRQLVEAMGGELQVQSTVGKGSIFWFDVNFTEIPGFTPKTVTPGRQVRGYIGKRRTVLIVDDELENRSVLVNMLAPLGFEILEAENGQECLEKTIRFTPEVILLDIRMPVMNGFVVARRIRNADFGFRISDSQIPNPQSQIHPVIIAVSASVFEESRRKCLDAGCDDFLAKPFQVDELLKLLQKYLQIEWIYAEDAKEQAEPEPTSDVESVQFTDIPSDRVKNLLEFAERGSLTKILAELKELEQIDAQYAPLVKKLRQLTQNFQFEDMIELLKR
jgi:PAS domain S-box-containing protein